MNKNSLIRKIYLYSFSLLGLVLITIGAVELIGLGLKVYVFTKADNYYSYPAPKPVAPPVSGEKSGGEISQPSETEIDAYQRNQITSQRQREAAGALAMIIVGLPLYFYHWRVIKKDKGDAEYENE